jgi:hypothetical protein
MELPFVRKDVHPNVTGKILWSIVYRLYRPVLYLSMARQPTAIAKPNYAFPVE